MKRNKPLSIKVKLSVRVVLPILAIALSGIAMGQGALTDNDCRITLTDSFNGFRVYDTTNLTASSYALQLSTTEKFNSHTTTYSGWLKLYDDANPAQELVKAELTLYRGGTLMQRTVADGKRVWSYDPASNAYSVNAYNVEQGNNSPRYRLDFANMLKQTAAGAPLNLMTLWDQATLSGTARVKDWLGGITFEGTEEADNNDPTHFTRYVWQKLPDNSRFVEFVCESHDTRATWQFISAQIHRADRVGSSTRVSDTFLTIAKDTNGVPLTFTANSTDFAFVPPARSKVLATPRTVKF
jgi:hypothetical protein